MRLRKSGTAQVANDLTAEMARLVEEVMEAVGGSHPAVRRRVFYVVEAHKERMGELLDRAKSVD